MGTTKGNLSKEQEKRLSYCFEDIKKNLLMDDVAGDLMKENVLTMEEWEELHKKTSQESKRTEEFLFILRRRPSCAYASFIKVLSERGYGYLARKLGQDSRQEDIEGSCVEKAPVGGYTMPRIASFPDIREQDKLAQTDDGKQMVSALREKNDLKSLKGEMFEMKGAMKGMKGKMDEMKGEMKGQMDEMKGEMKGQMDEMKGQLEGKLDTVVQMMQTLTENKRAKVASLKKQHAKEKNDLLRKIQELEHEVQEYKEKLKKKEDEMTQLRKNLIDDFAAKEVDKLKNKLKEKQDELETLKKQVEGANVELANLRPVPMNSARKSPDDPILPAHAMYQTTFRPSRDTQIKEQSKKK